MSIFLTSCFFSATAGEICISDAKKLILIWEKIDCYYRTIQDLEALGSFILAFLLLFLLFLRTQH